MSESHSRPGAPLKEVLTLSEAAAHLRVQEADLADFAERNGIPARKIGKEWRFLRKALNLQPRGGKAKAYQVKQVRSVLTSYGLAGESEAEEPGIDEAPRAEPGPTATEEDDGG